MTPEQYLELPYALEVACGEADDGAELWVGRVAELDGCVAQGRTRDELLANLRRETLAWIGAELERGRAIPLPGQSTVPAQAAAPAPAAPAPASEPIIGGNGATPTEDGPSFSGQFRVRLPASLHATLVAAAAREGVSLNQLVVGLLAGGVRWEGVVPRLTPGRPKKAAITS